mgnify:CR=1 FL=1
MIPTHLAPAARRLAELPRGEGSIELLYEDGVVEVVVNNPTRSGAIGPGMMADLSGLGALLDTHAPAAVVIHSTSPPGRAFCAGGDLKSVRAHLMSPEAAADMCDLMSWVLDGLRAALCVVVAAVEGPALGGGAELLTVCDRVFAGPDARVGFVHARLGVSPGWGGGQRLVERVGHRRALWWLTEARSVDAQESLEQGMLDVLVQRGQALSAARRHARKLAELPRDALQAAVALARGTVESERALFLTLWGGPDHRAALGRSRVGR